MRFGSGLHLLRLMSQPHYWSFLASSVSQSVSLETELHLSQDALDLRSGYVAEVDFKLSVFHSADPSTGIPSVSHAQFAQCWGSNPELRHVFY